MPATASVTRTDHEGHAAVVLAAGELEAIFVPGAGMLGASLRHRGEELLGQRAGLAAYVERGKTMGIPFLHPWANRLSETAFAQAGQDVDLVRAGARLRREEHGLPIHGLFGAAAGWEVADAGPDATGERATVRAVRALEPELLAAFPFPHRVEHAITLSADALTVTTTVAASGDVPVPIAFGFHPYLRLPGLPRAEWQLTLPARRALLTRDGLPSGETRELPAEHGAVGERTWDDGYDELGPAPRFALTGGGRALAVVFVAGYPVAQVFAPPGEVYVALEPMTAPTDALVTGQGLRLAAPGEPFTAEFRIEVAAA